MPENTKEYQERLASLRTEMEKSGLDGFILPCTDEFQGEFLPAYAQRLRWLTGFTGSAGVVVVFKDKAVVMSDGRYTIQLAQQVDGDLYSLADSTKFSAGQWIAENAMAGMKIGYDEWLYTPKQLKTIKEEMKSSGAELTPLERNLIDTIWLDQPPRPQEAISLFPDDIAGQTSLEKRRAIAKSVEEQGASFCLLSMGDSICWLLNVRGADIDYSPLMLSYAILYIDGSVDWFVGKGRVPKDVRKHLGADVRIFDFEDMHARIESLSGAILVDESTAPSWFVTAFEKSGLDIANGDDPCAHPKSIKSQSEQEAIRTAHRKDGVAVSQFLQWVDDNANKIALDELLVEERLEAFRCEDSAYLGPSFATIAGFNANGAIVHYRADVVTNKSIAGDGLLLVDSGGQYHWGTTDITRTIAIGTPTREMQENYTRVLKGHIAISKVQFPKGTTGKKIDALAREFLQEVGLDYAHGTGHGVGCYLCVHEAAANLSPRGDKELEAGMLLSNEPGYYKEGEYGIRIENLVLVQECEDDQNMLCFETVTRAPYDDRLIIRQMLSEQELSWLENYSLAL